MKITMVKFGWICLVLCALALNTASDTGAQPDISWGQYNWEGTFAQCMERSPLALDVAGFKNRRQSAGRGWTGRQAAESNNQSALVICYEFGQASLPFQSQVTVVVTATGDRVYADRARKTIEDCLFRNVCGCSVEWSRELVPCSEKICGGYAQNRGRYAPEAGKAYVKVCGNGEVWISMPALVNRQTGRRVGKKSFEINYGVFGNEQWSGGVIGGFSTTDPDGSFEGKSSAKITLPVTKSFVLNSDGASQFISLSPMPPFYPQPVYPDKQR